MSTCNNDKKKAFLNNTKARNRHRIIENQKMLDKSTSKMNGKTKYSARILALPREETANAIVISETGESYVGLVKIRVELLDSSIPDPSQDNLDENTTIVSINMHRDALVSSEQTGLEAGDIVIVEFQDPPMVNGQVKNNINPPAIIRKLKSDRPYYDKMLSNLGKNRDKLASLTSNFESASASNNTDYTPRSAKHFTSAVIKNGDFDNWPDAVIDYFSAAAMNILDENLTYNKLSGEITWTPKESGDFLQKANFNQLKGLWSNSFVYDKPDDGYQAETSYVIATWNQSKYPDLFVPKIPSGSLAKEFLLFLIEHFKNWGTKININEPHRTLDKQIFYWERKLDDASASAAAYPGTSNHGWAMAFDVSVGINRITGYYRDLNRGLLSFIDAHSVWVHTNMTGFSITEGKRVNEPWHLSFTQASRKAAFPEWRY